MHATNPTEVAGCIVCRTCGVEHRDLPKKLQAHIDVNVRKRGTMALIQLVIKKLSNKVLEVRLVDLVGEGMYSQFAFYEPF